MSQHSKSVLLVLAACLLAGCATYGPVPSVQSACLSTFQNLDKQLAEKGLHDAAAYRIPGYPYLRLTRFMASFADELDSFEKRKRWLTELRREDQRARGFELGNLGQSEPVSEVLADCGQLLVAELLSSPDEFARLLSRAQVPDDYSTLARVLGLYPLAVPLLGLGVQDYHQEIRQDYQARLDVPEGSRLINWRPESRGEMPRQAFPLPVDALGIPDVGEDLWNRLLTYHAPVWQVEVAAEDDVPGAIVMSNAPAVDPVNVMTYVSRGFTRFEGQVLPQLVYMLWFPRRTAVSRLDFYAGEFDALVWRVTLDSHGRPLAYDSMHACGCYQYFYPVSVGVRPQSKDWWQEPVLVPQVDVPKGAVVLRVQAGTHYLRRVQPVSPDTLNTGTSESYTLASYDGLRSLPVAEGQRRSLFSANGLLPGSERLERLWLWPSGVVSPGAMRQLGRHATAFIGRRHFDDPFLLEEVFTR